MDDDETLELNTDYNTVNTGDTSAQPRNLDIAAVPGEDRWEGHTVFNKGIFDGANSPV